MYSDKLIYRKIFTSLRNQEPNEDSLLNVVYGTHLSEFEAKIANRKGFISCVWDLVRRRDTGTYIKKSIKRSHCHVPLNENKIVADYLCNFLENLGYTGTVPYMPKISSPSQILSADTTTQP